MEFRILGPMEVVGTDVPVLVRGAKRRGLLAYLLVHTGEPVSTDRLVDELWGERPSPGARGTVQSYLSGFRKLLAAGEGVALETHPSGYVLTVPPSCIDTARFERLCTQAASEGEPTGRLESVDEALSLWRGAPLGEFVGSAWADVEATRLEALRLQALHLRVEALLALGRHAETVPELEALVGQHHLDERLWAQLMIAYYRTGRQADALRAGQRARSVLAEELGIEPGAELAELERQVLDHDPALASSAPTQPAAVEPGPFTDRPALPARLCHDGTFVGRTAEIVQLRTALDAVRTDGGRRVVLIGGEPGIGKTTLAARSPARPTMTAPPSCRATATRAWQSRTSRGPKR